MKCFKCDEMKEKIKEKALFFRKYLMQSRHIGSVTPSSRFLARAVGDQIDSERAKVVVELGAGTGVLTQEITKRLPAKCDFVVVERDQEFVRMLKNKFNGSHVWLTEAQNMHQYLDEHGFKQVDYFISGLPFRSLPKNVGEQILKIVANYLSPHGVFIAYSYFFVTYFNFKKFFRTVKVEFVLRNIPPAFVFVCRK